LGSDKKIAGGQFADGGKSRNPLKVVINMGGLP